MKSFHPSKKIDQTEVLIDTSPSINSPSTQYIISKWPKLVQYMERSAMPIWRSNATLIPSICAVWFDMVDNYPWDSLGEGTVVDVSPPF
jgi:hypothetical protein